MAKRRPIGELFDEKYFVEPNTGCWLWTAGINREAGYGRLRVDGVRMVAHRYSWEMHVGPIPEGMRVLHRCDTPTCVNPGHLFLGTQADNVADSVQKGRWARKPTPKQVVGIRGSLAQGETQRSIGGRYGVHQSVISRIHTDKNRRH